VVAIDSGTPFGVGTKGIVGREVKSARALDDAVLLILYMCFSVALAMLLGKPVLKLFTALRFLFYA